MKQTAFLTGATSGIGLAMATHLLQKQFRVYGVGRDFTKCPLINEADFFPITVDLSDSTTLIQTIKRLNQQEDFHLLVNAAGFGLFAPLEETASSDLEALLDVNLKAPILLTSLLLRNLKQTEGTIINIASIEALRASRLSSAYSATKAGLRQFGLCLFEEVRKAGVKVITINPDMTQTPFFDTIRFQEGSEPDTYLTPECIAGCLDTILSMRPETVVTEITLRPQRFGITKKDSRT